LGSDQGGIQASARRLPRRDRVMKHATTFVWNFWGDSKEITFGIPLLKIMTELWVRGLVKIDKCLFLPTFNGFSLVLNFDTTAASSSVQSASLVTYRV
jgi:hypothetical protein